MKRIHFLLIILGLAIGLTVLVELGTRKEGQKQRQAAKPNWLVIKYGPKHYSQNDEELIIRDFFNDKRNGYFVDVGANHYRINSTTYYLEERLDWSGIAIDAICDYGRDYLIHRKKTQFFCFFVSDRSDKEADFYVNLDNKRISTSNLDLASKQGPFDKEHIPTITLNDLLYSVGATHFDFLSMDIELAEPPALAGFDIQKYKPSLVCIEAHQEVRDQVLRYFSKNNYRLIEKYKGLDPLNFYFTPGADKTE
jgi:hypothetical protein